jgi:hypothetical protein
METDASGCFVICETSLISPFFKLHLSFPDKFGQRKCVFLRDSCELVDFASSLATRSLAHVCVKIVPHLETAEVGSTPVRTATANRKLRFPNNFLDRR